MDVLHLFANHKITGPAELALETARWLNLQQDQFHCQFYSSNPPDNGTERDRWLQNLAVERELPVPEWDDVQLGKHFSPFSAIRDISRLKKHLLAQSPNLIHAHSPNDHLIAGFARRKLKTRPAIIRSVYDGVKPKKTLRSRVSFSHFTDHLLCFSKAVARSMESDFGVAADRISVIGAPIDTDRFDPSRELPDLRQRFGIAAEAPVYGIVARMQTHRRFEVLIEAMQIVSRELPESRAIIVGRGTNQQTVAKDPVNAAGLSEHVIFSGYLKGDDYVGVLKAMDTKVYLVPGSDGTCRAAREALSMGVPVIAANRGMLNEIVDHENTGLVIEDSAEMLASSILEILKSHETRQQMSAQARERSVTHGSFKVFCEHLTTVYQKLTNS